MKYLKQYEEIEQKYQKGDFVMFKNLDYLKTEFDIPESKLEDFYYFFNNNFGEVRNAWVRLG